jgi:hypothetical protein
VAVGGGGGVAVVSKLTRLVVAVEGLVEKMGKVTEKVDGHETRIATLEGAKQARP